MLKKALTKSGQRILKAIKKLSTRTKKSGKKSSQTTNVPKVTLGPSSWRSAVPDHEAVSLSWSLASLDTKSVDTYLTSVSENLLDNLQGDCSGNSNDAQKCCCCCTEYEENQRNENRENEMFV